MVERPAADRGDRLERPWGHPRVDVDAIIRDAGSAARGLSLYDWQARALTAWERAGHRGIVAAVTGSGKTRVVLAAIDHHMSHWRRVAKAVVLVPTTDLAHQWRAEIERPLDLRVGLLGDGGTDSLFECDVLVAVVHSAARQVPEQVTLARGTRPVLLVADECHRYGADTFSGPWTRRITRHSV